MVDGRVSVSRHWANWATTIDAKGRKERAGEDLKRWRLRTPLRNGSSWNPQGMQNVRGS